MKPLKKYFRIAAFAVIVIGITSTAAILGIYHYFGRDLPNPESLKDIQFQVPLRIYSKENSLIGEFGEKKRLPLRYDEFPQAMVDAILAAEDDRFFEHPGVDYQGLIRAAFKMILTGEKRQGGSTITMQVARNFFLTREKTIIRKLKEIILALEIENKLTKEEILALYLNKIYLGHRSYGVAAAAQVYYGKPLDALTIAQLAMIAGLPKAPSTFNPIVNPDRAITRRNYVLRRMHELNRIDDDTYQMASAAPISASLHTQAVEYEAGYIAEMVRAEMVQRFGKTAYTEGYKVYTTVEGRLQKAANRALRNALMGYEHRHGYRGPEGHINLDAENAEQLWQEALDRLNTIADLQLAIVLETGDKAAMVYNHDGRLVLLNWQGLEWARRYIDDNHMAPPPKQASDIIKPGDIVRIRQLADSSWQLAQKPEVEGAMVSLRPYDGAVLALAGGYDFYSSKFNRITQAQRQPGSNFKPFVYSAALENGFTAASILNDAPVVFDDDNLESEWRPENYSGRFFGPTRLREALVRSRNLVSIRLLRATGIGTAIKHISGFGFNPDTLSKDLSLALGSTSITPFEIVRGYAVLANSGYLIEPYFIERILGPDDELIYQANPLVACDDCGETEEANPETAGEMSQNPDTPEETPALTVAPDEGGEAMTGEGDDTPSTAEPAPLPLRPAPRTISLQNTYLITSMMQDVIRRGTGRRALQLKRNDLAGKTGTTNEQRDAWFSGFTPDVVTTAWVGFDTPRPLGNRETGARAALPMWIEYMEEALKGLPQKPLQQPAGLVSVRIDPETGEYAGADNSNAIFEIFREEYAPQPPMQDGATESTPTDSTTTGGELPAQLF